MREIKFEVCIRRKDGTDLRCETLTVDDLLDRNGCLYNPNLEEIVYKRQYTGLKDKNSKEIYEGDIVLWFDDEYTESMAVEWDKFNAQWRWGNGTLNSTALTEVPEENSIVIGNVFENGDLLK